MSIFFSDISEKVEIKYDKLISDINNSVSYKLYSNSTSFYELFKNILLSLIHDKKIYLLDSDFSENEIKKILGNIDINKNVNISTCKYNNFNEILKDIKKSDNWELSLFTSGTTALPKKITHNFKSLTRNCKISENTQNDVWGYAYNPTHMAGLQVFFQALLNQNTIIRLFNLNKSQIFESISKYKISNISATPTFFRLLMPTNNLFESVTRLTSGGEKFDSNLSLNLKKAFPNAKLLNIYASTEAGSIFAAEGEEFYIRKSYVKWVKIEKGEIFLNKNILGKGVEQKLIDDWYPTGDMVEITSNNPIKFKFLSRKNEMINVGGYKVNPNEVEEVLLLFNGIVEARVFGKSNSVLGNIICAELVTTKKIEELDIRKYLSENIQEFKIPRIIKFVEEIKKTRTGKKKR